MRLQDVAEVTDGVENMRNLGLFNGKPAIWWCCHRQPGANVIDVVDRVHALLPELQAAIPARRRHRRWPPIAPTTIRASLHEVELTLLIAIALVVLVVCLFLRRCARGTHPGVAVPLSLLGTFGACTCWASASTTCR